MSSIVLIKQDIGKRVGEAAVEAGYSERNFRRYLGNKMVQDLPLESVRNLFQAGFISERTFQTVKQERINNILKLKKEKPCFTQSLRKFINNILPQRLEGKQ